MANSADSFTIFLISCETAVVEKVETNGEPEGPHTSAEWKIWAYSTAAPSFIAAECTVVDTDGTVLREGTSSTYWDSTNYKTQNLTAGKYYCWMHLSAESDLGASTAYVQIKRFNSSDSEQSAATQAVADIHRENGMFLAGVFNVSSGDYIKYTMWQNSGSATTQIYEAGDGSTMAGGGFKLA